MESVMKVFSIAVIAKNHNVVVCMTTSVLSEHYSRLYTSCTNRSVAEYRKKHIVDRRKYSVTC